MHLFPLVKYTKFEYLIFLYYTNIKPAYKIVMSLLCTLK